MGTNNATNNQLGNNQWLEDNINLSSADLMGMFASPIPIISAPGAGKFILVDLLLLEYFYNSITYTGGGSSQLIYTTSGNVLSNSITNIIVATNSKISGAQIATGSVPLANMINNGISISNAAAPFLLGDGTARVYIKYSIQDAP